MAEGMITKIKVCLLVVGLLGLFGCGSPSSDSAAKQTAETAGQEQTALVYQGSMELAYAQNFAVDYYEGGYEMLSTMDGTRILLVPEGEDIPATEEDVIVLQKPLSDLYLVSSSVMDMFRELDAIDTIRFSGQKAENWYIEEAREAMEDGRILYAGKYSRPDYEMIVAQGCSLAIENRMILHTPEVMEKLEEFGIPVLIEYSSYESHPLGRVEWVRFFGALTGREKEAEEIFDEQVRILEKVTAQEPVGGSVAFFYITSNGMVQVRQADDYIPRLIALAGGSYLPEHAGEENSGRSTVNMQMEEFYHSAKDAEYLIYNSSIDGGVTSVEELLDKCPLLEDFKAVREGRVYCTTNDMYQQSMAIGRLLQDIHGMLTDEPDEELTYLFRLW